MRYDNPIPDHSVNASKEHPAKEFLQLLIGIGVAVAVVVWLLTLIATPLAKRIPFSFEQSMIPELEFIESSDSEGEAPLQQFLQQLVDEIAPSLDLPEGMTVQVHYSDDSMVNAFATLGGHVVVFKGLLDELKYEDELVAILAHEVAHIKHRDPIVAFGKGTTLAIFAVMISGASGGTAADWLIGESVSLSTLQFSRQQERLADEQILQVLHDRYGHVKGAESLFAQFSRLEQDSELLLKFQNGIELFRSHPFSDSRWQRLSLKAKQRDLNLDGALTLLSIPTVSE